MTITLAWPEASIALSEHDRGVLVTDGKVSDGSSDQNCYVLRNWDLGNDEHRRCLEQYVETCLCHAFIWALQHGHPESSARGATGAETRQYLSFGRRYEPRPAWDVVMDGPGSAKYGIRRAHKTVLSQHGVQFDFEIGGGHNLHIDREDLARALSAIAAGEDCPPALLPDSAFSDLIAQIESSLALTGTEKQALISARRGQGRFREAVLRVEPYCRLTGVSDPRFLRAGHIKPWAASNNAERLDPANGLMLAPHADLLFDQGYISFADSGVLLMAPGVEDVLERWSLPRHALGQAFSADTCGYLAYHRERIFRSEPA